MVVAVELAKQTDTSSIHSMWSPEVPRWQPELSLEYSPGGIARRLWEARFREYTSARSAVEFTGIGGAVAGTEGVRTFKDGSIVPKIKDFQGSPPEVLFLVASTLNSHHIIALRSLAREYKKQGVQRVISVLTALDHERQDRRFTHDGQTIYEATTLVDVIEVLADRQYLDAGLIIQPHSLQPTIIAADNGFPLLPIDAVSFLIDNSGLEKVHNPFVMGPDKGRRDEARRLAQELRCPLASAIKIRDRLGDGYPALYIDPAVLQYIKDHNCNVITADDEVREGGTLGELGRSLQGVAASLTVCFIKGVLAGGSRITAVDHLNQDIITRIIMTDAVAPLTEPSPIRHKLEVVSLRPALDNLIGYLQANLVRQGDENWLRDPKGVGSALRLDLAIEKYD